MFFAVQGGVVVGASPSVLVHRVDVDLIVGRRRIGHDLKADLLDSVVAVAVAPAEHVQPDALRPVLDPALDVPVRGLLVDHSTVADRPSGGLDCRPVRSHHLHRDAGGAVLAELDGNADGIAVGALKESIL